MANSIYGAADSTLVNMAYKAAMANVPLDQTAVFAAREENLRNFTQLVSQLTQPEWDGYKETAKQIQDLSTKINEDIDATGGEKNQVEIDNHFAYVNGVSNYIKDLNLRKDLSSIQKDREATMSTQELVRYQASLKSLNEFNTQLLGNGPIAGNVYFEPGSKAGNTVRGILEMQVNKDPSIAVRSIDKGEIFYTVGGETMSMKEVEKGVTFRDPKYQGQVQKQLNKFLKETQELAKNKIDITPAQKERMIRILSDGATDIHKVRNLTNGIYNDNNHNFNEVFAGQAKTNGLGDVEYIDASGIEFIYNALDRAGGIDMDGKDGVTQKDKKEYRDPANALIVRKKILEDPEMHKYVALSWTLNNTLRNVDPVGTMERIAEAENYAKIEAAKNKKEGILGGFIPSQEKEKKEKETSGTFPTRTAADYKNMINK